MPNLAKLALNALTTAKDFPQAASVIAASNYFPRPGSGSNPGYNTTIGNDAAV